jgi:hypothetical protein
MSRFIDRLKAISKVQWVALALIIVGLGVMLLKAVDMMGFYREVQFATEHNFQSGNPSPDLLRPWMTIRYISAAYALPQQYIFDTTHIQPRKETSLIAIERLNSQMGLGQVNGEPALLVSLRESIVAYRANPVHPGLIERQVEEWMTMQYLANSTGIPVETFFAEIGVPMDGNAFLPLGYLSDVVHYSGGTNALLAALQNVVETRP